MLFPALVFACALDEEDEEDDSPPLNLRFLDLRSLEAEEFNCLLDCHLPNGVLQWSCDEDIGWTFEIEDLVLEVENIAFDTVSVRVSSGSMPRANIDPLRKELRQILSLGLENGSCVLDFALTLLQLAEEAVIHIHEWKNRGRTELGVKAWDVYEARGMQHLLNNPFGADLETIDDAALHILGRPVKDICKDSIANESLRILHVEPVLRPDLVDRLLCRQRRMLNQLMQCSYRELRGCVSAQNIDHKSSRNNRDDLARELCRPRTTFHGTSRWNIPSIVRYGFVLPGEKAGGVQVEVKFGSSFGKGIYSSPEARFALSYSHWSETTSSYEKTRAHDLPGLRLIICAVLMGRPLQVTREATRQTIKIADGRANSHVSPNMLEYIVFEAAQIVPCYIVHLDLGVDAAQEWLKQTPANPSNFKQSKLHPKLVKQELFPAELEAIKQERKAAALKWFPYGFGSATGTNFLIEEIGDVSDDEEIYGEYQGHRQEVEGEYREWEDNTDAKVSWFDEYQTFREDITKVKKEREPTNEDN